MMVVLFGVPRYLADNINPDLQYPGYMKRNRAFTVPCPSCHSQPNELCRKGEGGVMDGYTHISREKLAADLAAHGSEPRMSKDTDELKPCPFCGNAVANRLTHSSNGLPVVQCDECGARGPTSWSELFARRKWNQRDG